MKYLTLILTLIAFAITPYANADQMQVFTVRIIQFDEKDIHKYCARGGACYQLVGGMHTIYISRIKGEWDFMAHQKLGHKLHHAMGMKHF